MENIRNVAGLLAVIVILIAASYIIGEGSLVQRLRMRPEEPPSLPADFPRFDGAIGDRLIKIKVGVLIVEARDANELWVEFDPTVPAKLNGSQMVLPYIAAPSSAEDVVFYLHKLAGCSSAVVPSGLSVNRTQYVNAGLESCNQVVRSQPSSNWKWWDTPYQTEQLFRETFPIAVNACFDCQDIQNVIGVRRFKAIALSAVVDLFPRVELVDIDAQGLDVAILLSMNRQLHKVNQVKLECQNGTASWLYHNEMAGRRLPPNDCQTALGLLREQGFECREEVNNCGCSEFNLQCAKLKAASTH